MKLEQFFLKSIENNNMVSIAGLIRIGFDSSICNEKGIKRACELGYLEMVKLLIKGGCNFRINDDEPLRIAVKNNHENIVEFLLTQGCDYSTLEYEPVKIAINSKNYKILTIFLEYGCDFEIILNYADLEVIQNLKNLLLKDQKNRIFLKKN